MKIFDEIWITYKTRMIAEARYRLYNSTSHLLLVALSTLLIIASLFSTELALQVPYFQTLNTALAVLLLAASLIVWGYDFKDKANQHRACYLKLQNLERQNLNNVDIATKYTEILEQFPNHSERDFQDLILKETLIGNGKVYCDEHFFKWSFPMLFKKIVREVFFWASVALIPILLVYLFIQAYLNN